MLCANTSNASTRIDLPYQEKAVLGYDVTAKAVADRIRRLEANGEAGVVVLAGAGISVSAGIPDFRTPGTGPLLRLSTPMR